MFYELCKVCHSSSERGHRLDEVNGKINEILALTDYDAAIICKLLGICKKNMVSMKASKVLSEEFYFRNCRIFRFYRNKMIL